MKIFRWISNRFFGRAGGEGWKTSGYFGVIRIDIITSFDTRDPGGVRRIQHGSKHPSKIRKIPEKTVSENLCRNLMRKKNQNISTTALFHPFWIDFLAVPGGKGGGRYLKIPDDSNNLTRSLPRRGAADQIGIQNRCQNHEKSRLRRRCISGSL